MALVQNYHITGDSAAAIMASIEQGVRTGNLPPGQSLPPVRRLAQQLGVSPGTVASAYRSLRQRGIVETAGRAGTVVRSNSPLLAPPMSPLPSGVIDLSHGEPDTSLLPDLTHAISQLPTRAINYHQGGPVPELLELAREVLSRDGVEGSLTITGGALAAISLSLTTTLNPGDLVAIEDPGWRNVRDMLAASGFRTWGIPVDESGPTANGVAEALAAGARAVIVTNRAQNPTGATISGVRAEELRELLRGHPDLLLIEDDHWAELSQTPLHHIGNVTGKWVFVRSTSKPCGPDLRVAVVAADERTKTFIEGRARLAHGWVSTMLQHLVMSLWRDEEAQRAIEYAGRTYWRRQMVLRNALRENGIPALGHSGLNLWVPVDDEAVTVGAMRDRGYAVAPGSLSRIKTPPGVRITCSQVEERDVADIVEAMVSAVRPAGPSV
ncbi:aminotransferase class I/II-fold pyridoxal phosphate-dependent enzyme [Natronoglycomyces albus]|uniref:Aminotransferase class I/II-fold pyridoxal phosphate-dependent enzyme n=1 Tax=Natronoglycomyces albus TaxID=2811108 RepID=A0A895XSI6_9ACTN|nr:aminotransferase class I/II-fold pyridoxal phosphate-dependent enzyme [Natronoglycomyces albus]